MKLISEKQWKSNMKKCNSNQISYAIGYRKCKKHMTKIERNDVIKEMENEIKKQMPIILESIKCDTMTYTEQNYLKSGVELGLKTAIDILREERC